MLYDCKKCSFFDRIMSWYSKLVFSISQKYVTAPLAYNFNPDLASALSILRQEMEGSFSDSYLHQLFLPFKLVNFFGKSF